MNPSQIAGRASAPEADNKLVDALVRACAIIIGERQMLVDSYTEAGGVQVSPDAQDDLERFDEVLKAADEALAAHQAAPTLTPEPPSQPVAADAPAEVVHCERNDAFKSALMATGRVANFDPRGRPRAAPVEVHGATEPVLMEHDERAAIFLEEIGFEPRDLQSVNESELHRIAMRIEARVLAKNSPVAQTLASRPAPAAEAEPVEWKGLPSGEVFDMGCEVMKFLKERGAPYFYSYRMAAILHGDPEAKLYTRPAAPLSEADAVLRAAEAWADSKPDSMRACRTLVDAVIAYQAVIAALRPTPSNERR